MAFRFEGLEVFQLAVDYAALVYRVTSDFPREEMFGLIANLRRAATSISANIGEGAGRGTDADFRRFVDIATGSLFETLASLIVARRLGFLSEDALEEVRSRATVLGKKLNSFKRTLNGNRLRP